MEELGRSLYKKMRFEIKYIAFYLKEFALMKLELMHCTKQLVNSYLNFRTQFRCCHLREVLPDCPICLSSPPTCVLPRHLTSVLVLLCIISTHLVVYQVSCLLDAKFSSLLDCKTLRAGTKCSLHRQHLVLRRAIK